MQTIIVTEARDLSHRSRRRGDHNAKGTSSHHRSSVRATETSFLSSAESRREANVKGIRARAKRARRDSSGSPPRSTARIRETRKHNSTERELLESEERYRSLFEGSRDAITINTADGKFVDVNQAWLDLFGYSREEALTLKAEAWYVDPADRARFRRKAEQEGFVKEFEVKLRRKDGGVLDCLLTSTVWRNKDGHILGYQGIIHDQTERKRLEETLRGSEERFRQLFQFSPIPYLITLPEGPILDVNDAWVRMSGYSRKEAIGRSTIELGMMLDPQQRDQLVRDVLQKRRVSNIEIKRRAKSGEIRSLLNSLEVVELGGQTCILNMQVDITERKRTEGSLQRSQEELRSFIDAIPYYAYIIDTDGTFILVNQWTAKRFREPTDQLVGSCIFNLLSSDMAEDRKAIISQVVRSGKSASFETTRGEEIIDYRVYPILDGEKRVSRLAVLGIDISARRKLEEELKRHSEDLERLISERTRELVESEEKYRGIYEASLNAIYTTSLDGTIVDMNPAGVLMFGFDTLDELRKMNVIDLYADPNDRKTLIKLVQQGPVKGHEIQLKRRDGRIFDAFLNAYALRDQEKKIIGLQGAIMDITERRELERMRDQLTSTILLDVTRRRELEKIRDQFISVVTHELRTPLTSIKGYVDDVLTGEVGQMSEQVASSLLVVKRNTDRLLELVNELLEIRRLESGRFQLDLSLFDFREVANHCAQEIRPLIDEKGQIFRMEIPEEPMMIRGDRTRLIQVLMNLLNNANKFTPEGGNIVLCMEERGESIRIRVSDTGIGVRKEDLERVFEPFAAIEKPTYVKGTGLGLSVTRGLVEAHRGKIWAESPGEGQGTTLIFVLPKEEATKSD